MYQNKKIIHIVAAGNNGEIGFDNSLLWHIPEDLKFFKESTLGHVVLMGRKTVESLPKPLDRRIVIGATTLNGRIKLNQWLDWCITQGCVSLNTNCIYIAGGASIYEQTKDIVDEVLLTRVCEDFNHADTFYHLPEHFTLKEQSEEKDYKGLKYYFSKWS